MPSAPSMLFTSLWVGEELPPMSRLCIKSFLDHGHSFQLFCYKRYEDMPPGVKVRDAREILPEEDIFRDTSHNSFAPFADWFRMKFLSEEGGFWVDMDVVCLKDEAPTSEVWVCRQNASEVAVGAMRFPAHHPVPTALAKLANDPASPTPWDTPAARKEKELFRQRVPDIRERRRRVPWGFCGPQGLTQALKHFGLYEQAAPPSNMYPVSWENWQMLYSGEVRLSSPSMGEAWCIHLWGEMLRYKPDVWDSRSSNSLVSELLLQHTKREKSPPSEKEKHLSILVGVCSCHGARARREACRETWLSRIPDGIAYKFFLGKKTKGKTDEGEDDDGSEEDMSDVVQLDVNDSYIFLPAKGIAFYQFALEHYNFDWLFKCDDDSYVALDRLETLCKDDCDMVGDISVLRRGAPSGGAGYLMRRQLVEKFVQHEKEIPETGAEDLIFGSMTRSLGARMRADNRLNLGNAPSPRYNNDVVSCHWCSPEKLRDIHNIRFRQKDIITCKAVHPYWRDEIRFFPNGRFMRRLSGCSGNYRYEEGKRILRLIWDDWDEEQLELQSDGNYVGKAGFCLFMKQAARFPTRFLPRERPMKCVFLTSHGEIVEGAWRAMQLGYEVEIYPTTPDTSSLKDTYYEESRAYLGRTPESAERAHVRSLRASFIRLLRDHRYSSQENIIFCESDAVPLIPAADMLKLVEQACAEHPTVDVLRPFHTCVWEERPRNGDASSPDITFTRMELMPERDPCHAAFWGTHALVIPSRSREKVARAFSEYRLPTDVTLCLMNGREELEVYTASANLFVQLLRIREPHPFRIAGMLSSYKRLKELQRQIGCMMDQTYDDFHLFVAIKGISEFDFHRILEPQFQHFVDMGRLTMRLFPNRNQLSNLLDTVRDLDVSAYDLFAKIDDDDIYAHDYISQLNEFHGMLPGELGSCFSGRGGYYRPERGFPTVSTGHFGFYGPTLVIPKRVLDLLFSYEEDPSSIMEHFDVEDHGYLCSSFSFREDALIDFINRRMGACNRAVYANVQGKELSLIICQDTPSVLRGSYVSQDLIRQINGTKPDIHANESLLYLVHPDWCGYLKILGTRACRLGMKEEGNVLHFDEGKLIIKWDNWGEESFELQSDGSFQLVDPSRGKSHED